MATQRCRCCGHECKDGPVRCPNCGELTGGAHGTAKSKQMLQYSSRTCASVGCSNAVVVGQSYCPAHGGAEPGTMREYASKACAVIGCTGAPVGRTKYCNAHVSRLARWSPRFDPFMPMRWAMRFSQRLIRPYCGRCRRTVTIQTGHGWCSLWCKWCGVTVNSFDTRTFTKTPPTALPQKAVPQEKATSIQSKPTPPAAVPAPRANESAPVPAALVEETIVEEVIVTTRTRRRLGVWYKKGD
jgi:hypothetical protein